MPELLRSIVNRLRGHVGNRRAAPRYTTHLEAGLVLSVSFSEGRNRGDGASPPLRLAGYTRDISQSGLALIVPSIHIGGQYLTGPNRTLEIILKLPTGPVHLQAMPVRYSPLADDDAGSQPEGVKDTGYIVGVRITKISEQDRALYDTYLDKLMTKE
jgi:hypothetical protein